MQDKWAKRWLRLAHEVAAWSKDQVQVGAIISDQNRNPRGFGYNGMPRNINDDQLDRQSQPKRAWYFEHAERNVIYACARNGISCDACTMYVTHFPCCDCTRAIIQSGISHVVVDAACVDPETRFYQKWQDQITESQHMMTEAGVTWELVNLQNTHNTQKPK